MKERVKMYTKVVFAAILILVLFVPVLSASAESSQLINVSGTGTVSLQPDFVTISLGITTERENVQDAINENAQKVQSLKNALFAEGLTDADITTTDYSLYSSAKYYQDPTAGPDDMIYNVYYYLNITLKDLTRLNLVLDTAVNNGATTISSLYYDSTERDAAFDQACDLAIENGRAKAEKIAEKLGVTLGTVDSITVNEGNSYYEYGIREGRGGGGDAATATINPGLVDITVTANLAYTFDL